MPDVTGLSVAEKPRRAVRSRSGDQLILYMSFQGGASFSEAEQNKIVTDLVKTYYKVTGSVTSALREAASSLNDYLFTLNMQDHHGGQPVIGLLTQLVRRDEQIYLAQSGPVYAYCINASGSSRLYDPKLSGRGIGLDKDTPIRYYHTSLASNDTFILATLPSPTWGDDLLAKTHGQGPEGIRRRLLPGTVSDTHALLVQARPGKGKITFLRSRPTFHDAGDRSGQAAAPAVAGGAAAIAAGSPAQAEPVNISTSDADSAEGVKDASRPTGCLAAFGGFLGLLLRPVGLILQNFAAVLDRIIPVSSLTSISSTTMAFVALIVPVLVVGVATLFYIQRGVSAQSQVVYEQAMELASQADGEADLLVQRELWIALLDHLEKAETLYSIPDAVALRNKAQTRLDSIDMVVRTEFQPAIFGGLPGNASISRIVLSDDEIYMLDRNNGEVLHATLTEQGYVIDDSFQCGPGALGVENPLVDIVSWPAGFDPEASLFGMDAEGGVVYCQPGEPPKTGQLAIPEGSDLTGLTAAKIDLGHLYVLDPDEEAVWIYWNSEISQPPQYYFADQVPQMDDVLDFMVNSDELYLLHADGHLTLCQFSWIDAAPTRCVDPVSYLDTRPDRENQVMVPDDPFSKILYNTPPDPSLYLLEPENHSIYHFSLRSPTFQRQYMPNEPLGGRRATAFAVDTFDRLFFLAVGNDVYYARIP